jgi:DNA-binding IclR family transcriptional regulator
MLFNNDRAQVSALEVSSLLNMPRSTTYRYLQSLRESGFLEVSTRGFRIGPRILELANVARLGLGLSDIAVPVMRRLSKETGETALLTRLAGANVVCLDRVESERPVRLSYEPGHILPVHAGAHGKVVLAWADQRTITDVVSQTKFTKFTENTVLDAATLLRDLEEIREQGYVVCYGEIDEHVVGIAAPVRDAKGTEVAGLGIAAVKFLPTEEWTAKLVAAVIDAAEEVSQLVSSRGLVI